MHGYIVIARRKLYYYRTAAWMGKAEDESLTRSGILFYKIEAGGGTRGRC